MDLIDGPLLFDCLCQTSSCSTVQNTADGGVVEVEAKGAQSLPSSGVGEEPMMKAVLGNLTDRPVEV